LSAIRVRFAPSPTGFLHVGGLRTALYNFLFARKHNGTFILRIEDTDRSRYVEGAVDNLIKTLQWAGLYYDEGPGKEGSVGPYIQSERISVYQEYAFRLIAEGNAYYAFDTPEELEEMRKNQEQQGLNPKYDRRGLRLTPEEVRAKREAGTPAVVRMKMPDATTMITVEDLIRGNVEFLSDRIDDQVLLKSDGYPTYHLANVVDDHLMGITHVIRGEEWLSSTPKHVLLYNYLGWDVPAFAHLPLLLNPDKTKLSKRQGDVAVEDYRQKGYLKEALVNFVALLGWNPGDDREIFSLENLVQEFSLERVGKSGAVFNLEKLNWMNAQHLRAKPDEELLELIRPHLAAIGATIPNDAYILRVIPLLRERVEKTEDFVRLGGYFFADPEVYDDQARRRSWKPESSGLMNQVVLRLQMLDAKTVDAFEAAVRGVAEEQNVGAGKLIHPLRLALTGMGGGPGLFDIMALLGRETCVRRIERAVSALG
jgi:glutamyl-tRNA synthetase